MRRSAAPSNGGRRPLLHRPLHPTQPRQQQAKVTQPDAVRPKPGAAALPQPAAAPRDQRMLAAQPQLPTAQADTTAGAIRLKPGGFRGFRPPVRAGGTAAQSRSQPAETMETDTHYYTVMYTKDVRKKAKVWQDGVMAHVSKKLVLFAIEDGKQVATTRFTHAAQPIADGEELDVFGRYLVEVVSQLQQSDFTSGRVFLGNAAKPAAENSSALSALPTATSRKFRPVGRDIAATTATIKPAAVRSLHNPDAPNALVLDSGQDGVRAPVVVDPVLARELRPHQREGVKFLFECVTGKSDSSRLGCILADEMGLGKTLQCIALTWTLLKQGGLRGGPAIKKACVVCPSSLVGNWEKEFRKWLGRERIRSLAVDPKLEDITSKINDFQTDKLHHVIIISYELYRKYSSLLNKPMIDLLLCDEGHRLKSSGTNKTIAALNAAPTQRRIIITGTPVQNDLEEFYSMCDFVNPNCLGALSLFRRVYAAPIMASRDAAATAETSYVGQQRSDELNSMTKSFMLRRDASINKKHLPPKVELFVFCRLAPLQRSLYSAVLKSKALQRVFLARGQGSSAKVAADADMGEVSFSTQLAQSGAKLFEGSYSQQDASISGKLCVLQALLQQGKAVAPTERWVIISNFTKTLDLISDFCRDWGHTTLRLDGSTASGERNSLVERFNSNGGGVGAGHFIFLLSAKAGGVGLNLIGANRLVLLDPDWNPATDQQASNSISSHLKRENGWLDRKAMARVWRDGQRKNVTIYRLFSTGSIEEKILQRQMTKGELADDVSNATSTASGAASAGGKKRKRAKGQFTREELKDIFSMPSEELTSETAIRVRKRTTGGSGSAAGWSEECEDIVSGSAVDSILQAVVGIGGAASKVITYLYNHTDAVASMLDEKAKLDFESSMADKVRADDVDALSSRSRLIAKSMPGDEADFDDSEESAVEEELPYPAAAAAAAAPERRHRRRHALPSDSDSDGSEDSDSLPSKQTKRGRTTESGGSGQPAAKLSRPEDVPTSVDDDDLDWLSDSPMRA